MFSPMSVVLLRLVGGYVSSDDNHVSLSGGGYVQGRVGMSRGWVCTGEGWVCPG